MTVCTSPGCAEPGTVEGKFSRWCPEHASILKRVAAQVGERPKRTTTNAPARSKADRAKLDEDNARRIARVVCAQDVPATGVHHRVGLVYGSEAWRNAVALATERGWIALDAGRGFVKGETPPPRGPTGSQVPVRDRALALARHCREAGETVSNAEASRALGASRRTVARAAAFAGERGWIESRLGVGGGYVATAADLPAK